MPSKPSSSKITGPLQPCDPAQPCGCHEPGDAGRHALGVNAELKAANTLRLKRAEGQVRGIARMIEQDRYCADIITQISAVQESLRVVAKNLLKNHMQHCASAALTSGDEKSRAEMIDELTDLLSKIAR